jgi:hypothetical protein
MRLALVLSAGAAAIAVCGCKTMSYDAVTAHAAGGGAQFTAAPSAGLTVGYIQTDTAITPVVDQKGSPITVKDACGASYPLATYSILNGNATASTSTANGQSAAVAVNRAQAVGEAAAELARADVARAVGPNYDVERAARDCSKVLGVLAPASAPK